MVPPHFVLVSDEFKTKTVCENQELKLHCHETKFLNIYSATYGRTASEKDICSFEKDYLPQFGKCCYNYSILSNRLRAEVKYFPPKDTDYTQPLEIDSVKFIIKPALKECCAHKPFPDWPGDLELMNCSESKDPR